MKDCPFCDIPADRIQMENGLAVVALDLYPVNPGHALVIPKRHVAHFLDLTDEENAAIAQLIRRYCNVTDADGFNVGVNGGRAAGQTVMHVHYHIIPRYVNDQPDPRGGIRKIFPEKAAYWNPIP